MNPDLSLLAQEGHGAIEVEAADPDQRSPLWVFLAGPLKYWWGDDGDGHVLFGGPLHQTYTTWRDAVETVLVKNGLTVSMPHKAIRGRWHPRMQEANRATIRLVDVLIDLTPPGVPAEETSKEVELARSLGTRVIPAPPGKVDDLVYLVERLQRMQDGLKWFRE